MYATYVLVVNQLFHLWLESSHIVCKVDVVGTGKDTLNSLLHPYIKYLQKILNIVQNEPTSLKQFLVVGLSSVDWCWWTSPFSAICGKDSWYSRLDSFCILRLLDSATFLQRLVKQSVCSYHSRGVFVLRESSIKRQPDSRFSTGKTGRVSPDDRAGAAMLWLVSLRSSCNYVLMANWITFCRLYS